MTKIAIICALRSERKLFTEKLDNREDLEINGLPYSTGTLFGKEIVVCNCGVGKVNAAMSAQIVIDRFDPDYVINSGISGSLSKLAPHLSIVVSDKLYYHDFDLSMLVDNNYPGVDRFSADRMLIKKFFDANSERNDLVLGNIATGDVFVTSSAKKQEIQKIGDAISCEMEGAAIAHVAYANKKPFIVLRCISDLADDDAGQTFDDFEVIAADKVANSVINLIKEI